MGGAAAGAATGPPILVIALYMDENVQGQIVIGPTTVTYHVVALVAGTYYFHCDVHPTAMQGTFVVK